MYSCIASCLGIWTAWHWSMGTLPFQTDEPRTQSHSPMQRKTLDNLLKHFTVKLDDGRQQRWWTLVTPAFSHIQTYHIAGNLFAFSTFSRMLLAYGIAPARRALHMRALGLSGVVMGLGAAVSLATPKSRVLLFGAVPVPVWLVMLLYTAYDSARLDDQASTVGHAAHLGGAAFGAVYYLVALRNPAALPFAWLFRL
ncbi:hypothetical protein CLAIMM_02983 [Cladophialophora immunda]|nr:hypothetical protein CLAIMM_02983 [Cladophialophora immunda]